MTKKSTNLTNLMLVKKKRGHCFDLLLAIAQNYYKLTLLEKC